MFKFLFILFLNVQIVAQEGAPPSVVTNSSLPADTENINLAKKIVNPIVEKKSDFLKSADLFGDLRYRQQNLKIGENQDRPVQRLMFRVGHAIQVQDDLKLTYRFMTGTSNVSGNSTIGDSKTPMAPRQSIGLDQAFANYSPVKVLNFFIGKMPQFFATAGKNQIILDRDIALEGLGLQFKEKFVDHKIHISLNAGSFVVREKYDDTFGEDLTDSNLNIAQAALSFEKNEFKLNIGHGIFSYTAIKDDKPTSYAVGATSAKGNTLDLLGNYQWQYEIVQNMVEFKWSPKNFEISAFAESLKNTAADHLNTAQLYGASLVWKKITISYINQKIENDAVMAMYTDSDFSDGQTNSEGTILSISYKFNKNASLGYAEYKNKQSIDTLPVDYRRRHIDLTLSF